MVMDKDEKVKEIALKLNTLKMYNSTIEQLENNDILRTRLVSNSLEKIKEERDSVAEEIKEILGMPEKKENEFVKKINEEEEETKIMGFYDNIKKGKIPETNFEYDIRKPRLAEVQDKISNSKWISRSNFILRFPKNKINIDEWRVSSFYYTINHSSTKTSCNPFYEEEVHEEKLGGTINIDVNDFSEEIHNGEYNILLKIIYDLYLNPVVGDDITVDVIDNNGNLLYTLVFEKPVFYNVASGMNFDYSSTELNKVTLSFIFKNLIILAPNEDLEPAYETTY